MVGIDEWWTNIHVPVYQDEWWTSIYGGQDKWWASIHRGSGGTVGQYTKWVMMNAGPVYMVGHDECWTSIYGGS